MSRHIFARRAGAVAAIAVVVSIIIVATAVAAQAAPVEDQSVRVLLVGDSTMAPETGYGDALCQRFQASVACLNLAKGGRSSSSYRAEGSWEKVQNLLRSGEHYRATYVLIQFGHNDQPGKPGRSTDLKTEFPANMAHYVQDVKAGGAIPVLATPLTRRSFQGAQLQNDLRPWAEATRRVAAEEKVAVLDLNADSAAAVQAMGSAQADTLAMAPPESAASAASEGSASASVSTSASTAGKARGNGFRGFDRTHLGAKGAALFSGMVEQELAVALPSLAPDFKQEK